MNPKPPHPTPAQSTGTNGPTNNSMRIGPFWKRAADHVPSGGDEPFDALTDLFLGEVVGPRGTPRLDASRTATPSPAPSDGPMLRLAGVDDNEYQLAPSQPMTAPPEGDVATRPAAPVLTLDQDDDGEAMPVAAIMPPPARNPVLELIVLGNLPVLAGAWANQYVREIAEAAGKPVAYLRMQGDYVGLELVGALADVAGSPRPEDLGSLDEAIDAAAELTDRWIIRCDAGQESAVASCRITRAVTILTGTDQMAREACKLAFGPLVDRLPKPGDDSPMVRLALMGMSAPEDRNAGVELAAVAEELLSRPVATISCAAKIGGVRPAHTLFGGSTELKLRTIIASIERALVADPVEGGLFGAAKPAHSTPTPALAVPATPTVVEEIAVEVETLPEIEVPSADEFSSLANVAASSVVEFAGLTLPEPAPTIAEIAAGYADAHVATPVREPAVPVVEAPAVIEAAAIAPVAVVAASKPIESLASHVAELKTIAVRCPYADGVEIAVDGEGTLHLLARSSTESTDDSALAALLVASSWAESHAGMLAPSAGIAKDHRPALHLFTDRPKKSRRLLETNLRLHLLAPVQVGEEIAWFCTELN